VFKKRGFLNSLFPTLHTPLIKGAFHDQAVELLLKKGKLAVEIAGNLGISVKLLHR